MCHSEALLIFCTKLHSLGLILLLWGANIPLIYYGLYCNIRLQIVYWILTSLTAVIFAISLFWLSRPCYTTLGFQFLSLSVLIPVVHGLIAFGLPVQVHRLSLQWVIYALIGLTLGTAADAMKVSNMSPCAEPLQSSNPTSFQRCSSLEHATSWGPVTRSRMLRYLLLLLFTASALWGSLTFFTKVTLYARRARKMYLIQHYQNLQ
jgi:hypothetical protein